MLLLTDCRITPEQFSNGIMTISTYLNPLPNTSALPIEHSIFQFMKEVSLLYSLPDDLFFSSASNSSHAVQRRISLCALSLLSVVLFFPDQIVDCGWTFSQNFCDRLGASYLALKNILNEANPAHGEVLMGIKRRFREEIFTRESIVDVIHAHPELVHKQSLSHILFGMPTSRSRSACST